jgi:DNA-binding IclR family transcriptional regulator
MSAANFEVVKSVARVFEILELFDLHARPLTCKEISASLGYPPSSTIGLVKSMAKLGYLAFDCLDFTYVPTPRLAMVNAWNNGPASHNDAVSIMRRVHLATGESVSLCTESDGQMKVLALSPSPDIRSFSKVSSVGDCAPLFGSVVGLTALSTRSDERVRRTADRLLRRPKYIRPMIDLSDALARIRGFRASGFGVAYDLTTPNVGAMAWAVPLRAAKAPLVLGVWGPAPRIRALESALIATVTAAISAP